MLITLGLKKRVESLALRAQSLTNLRRMVALPTQRDINERQWEFLNEQLEAARNRILSKLKNGVTKYSGLAEGTASARKINSYLGEIEFELTKAFAFYDTYFDVLTQRNSAELGSLLLGCDVLASDALFRDRSDLAFVKPPIVYCDRGFGASILRENVTLPDGAPNPMPLIQIPHSRLKEKCNLTSILHEVGHQAMISLGLAKALPRLFFRVLDKAGASDDLKELFALWASEIGPDFWGFCASGIAQAASMKDIFALPASQVFRVSKIDPHPPAYLRTLLSFQWCREMWGRGWWDSWEKEWIDLYPMNRISPETAAILRDAKLHLPLISDALFRARFQLLKNRRIPDLFKMKSLNPGKLVLLAKGVMSGVMQLNGSRPCSELAVFRLIRERHRVSEKDLDSLMDKWIVSLGRRFGKSDKEVRI